KSLENYQASLLLTDSMNLISEKLEVLSGLSETYRKMGKYNESLDFYQEYIVLRDSVYNNRSRIMISELQSRYETDKKEKEIELLTVENDIKTLSLQKSRNQFNLVLIILILSCILVGIFLLLYRLKTRTNKILEQKNHELTSMNDLLQLSEDRLKEINEAKNRLFGIVSHDLRNSFNVLLGFSEILAQKARTLDDAKRLQYNEAIYKSSRQMYELLDNLLKWTNKQTGAIRNNPEVTDLRIVITEISELLQINAREKGINIIIGIPQNLYILFDRNLLSTIVRNLLANAVKFSHPGNNVHINCSEKEGFIEISITDTGIGIPAAKMDKLFRIDERFTSEGTNQEKGTGLGLILCREFTEMMDGSIKVESTEGKGSTFTVCIPLKQYNL
ncbi:MAG: HAMP domain-containing sensor histidine kinase, partial [Bacteroidota bacterium]